MTLRQVTPANGASQITIVWHGGGTVVTAGQILDVVPGSAHEAAIGTQNLTALSGAALADDQQGEADGSSQGTGNS